MSVGHLYVFLGEASVRVFCAFVDLIICVLGVEFEKFFIDLEYQPFLCNVICKYILPFRGQPLSFFDCLLAYAENFFLIKSQKFILSFVSLAFGDVS